MKHHISVCTEPGKKARFAHREDLEYAMSCLSNEEYASDTKEDSILIFNGYPDTDSIFRRREANISNIDTIFIDCDNNGENKDILDDFKRDMDEYSYYLYETFNSTEEKPKFRAIIPLDSTIRWDEDTKEAIFDVFDDYADRKASWFYAPTKNKIGTFEKHEGKLFPSKQISRMSQKIMTRRLLDYSNTMSNRNSIFSQYERKSDVSNNAKVRHYLDTSYTKMTGNGDSDSSLYVAICVCVTAGDDETLDDVLSKARMEHWSRQELDRKINQARRFVRKY